MPEERELSLKGSVENDDKIRVVTKGGLSQSIKVSNLKSSLSIDDLPDRVDTLEDKADTNETDHSNMDSRIEELELVVGERVVEDGTVIEVSGLFQEISNIRSEIVNIEIGEVDRLDGELDAIRTDITSIDGKNGKLDILTEKVNAGFKMIDEPPISASAAGQPGEVYLSAEYLYVCVGMDTWKRIPLEDW